MGFWAGSIVRAQGRWSQSTRDIRHSAGGFPDASVTWFEDVAIRTLLADDNALFRDGLAHLLHGDGRFEVVAQALSGDQAITLAAEVRPDLILIDLHMPGMSGIDAIRHIREGNRDVPIGVLTMFETREWVQSALDAGASGYLAKDSTPAEVCEAAVALAHGERNLIAIPGSRRVGTNAVEPGILATLTAREIQVLRALATTASNDAIAKDLGISPKTLRNHISNTYHKLGIHDRAQAVIVAVREGLVEVNRT
jgi:two-component system response regulator DegU